MSTRATGGRAKTGWGLAIGGDRPTQYQADREWLLDKRTPGERRLYYAAREMGLAPIAKMRFGTKIVVDVGFPKLKLAIEVGEPVGTLKYKRRRLIEFRANGWRLERVSEAAALADPGAVLDRLLGVVHFSAQERLAA